MDNITREEIISALETAYEYISESFKGFDEPEMQDTRPIPNYDEQLLLTALRRTIAKTKNNNNWGL